MSVIKSHMTILGFDLKAFVSELASMPTGKQKSASETVIRSDRAPLDYPAQSYKQVFEDNSDLLQIYYLKYLEKSKLAPEQCIDSLKIDFAAKVIDMVERNVS